MLVLLLLDRQDLRVLQVLVLLDRLVRLDLLVDLQDQLENKVLQALAEVLQDLQVQLEV
jgi:hypothetical protein